MPVIVNGGGINRSATGGIALCCVRHRHLSQSDARTAMTITLLAALLSTDSGAPAPGLPALLGRVELLTGCPLSGLAWAVAVGGLATWGARLSAGLHGLSADEAARLMTLAAMVAPALVPGAGVTGLFPAFALACLSAKRSGDGADRRVALMLAAAVIGVLADPRVAPAGTVALIGAARHLIGALCRGPANDDTPPPFAWRVSGLA